MTESSWESLKLRSKYHFKNDVFDAEYDTVEHIGVISPAWSKEEIDTIVSE